ncbi:Putative protein of unknown function [Podospora comata]|uniref:J domain-containing protein n=1 Tax=Podospora comata TaxID=48703 RepID=A0ABY6SMP1_PODCO|nr:Putative protein of unknown function [Podospora comata]
MDNILILIQLQDAYNVLIDPEERSSYDDKVLQTYMRWLECRMERITSCLACETDLDTVQKTELSALEDLQTHLQLELGSVTKLITNSKSPSSGRTPSDIRICRDGGLNKAKERFQIAAAEAASLKESRLAAFTSLNSSTTHCNNLRYELTGDSEAWGNGWDKHAGQDRMTLKKELEIKTEIGVMPLKRKERDLEAALSELTSVREELLRCQVVNAVYAARETVMKQRTMELERQNLKLANTATLLNTARAQLISKDMTLKTLGAENTKLKKVVSDYNNSMGILETSFQKVKETTNNLAIGALL